jgi:hypothetical protein
MGSRGGSWSRAGGGTTLSGSMGDTRSGERMRRRSMTPPRLESLDEAGEPLKDDTDRDLGGSFLPHLQSPPPALQPPPPPPPEDDAARGGKQQA